MHILEFNNVTFSYKVEEKALDGVNLRVNKGEFVAIIGHNGSGKSTFAKHINALYIPSDGTVQVLGMLTSDDANVLKIRQHAGMVFQNPDNQMVTTIVEDDVAFGPENLGIPPAEIRKRVTAALETVHMSKYNLSAPHNLSGGQKQRIAIAGVLAMEPDIIVLDEPTAMLDPIGRQEVLDTVIKLNRETGMTVLLITHFMEEAAIADRIVVMSYGKVAMEGTPSEIFARGDELKELGLDVPFTIKLSQELQNQGISIKSVIAEEEMVDEICQLLSNT